MNINLWSLYNKIYNCAFKIVLFFLHLQLKIFKKLKVKFILFLIISIFIQDIIATPINANTADKIAYKGLRCDYSDENVKFAVVVVLPALIVMSLITPLPSV